MGDARGIRTSLAIAGLMVCALAPAQDSMKRRATQGNSNAIVTQLDASLAFERLESVLFRLTGMNPTLGRMPSGTAPAKRTEIVARFDRVFEALKPKFVFTPRKIKFDPKSIGLPAGHPQRGSLEKLVKWGCLPKGSALTASKSEAVRLSDLGDAMGLFMMRIADLTHKPDHKFSPFIGGGSG